jgi:hypothetical protein
MPARSRRVYNKGSSTLSAVHRQPDGSGGGVNTALSSPSWSTTTANSDYTNGVDVHTGSG